MKLKNILLTFVVFLLSIILCGCSKEDVGEKDNTSKKEQKNSDLVMTRRIGSFDDLWLDLPNWREDGSETCTVIEYMNYYIMAVSSKEDYTFEELFNNETKPNLKHFVDKGTYDDFTPDSKEEVVLSNGINATKFDGILTMDSYGTLYKYLTYGYYFKYNNYPVMIISVETTKTSADKNSEEQRLATNKYVDEIVKTIRISE